ncbi:enoyl-CoA hydratase/isomerase family protein [Amorphus sp. 3PC139-8]|uniref:enoyl-CoA hydratase/isomerase family protein n=1 Tax=Amorphus sp. 3PC139-8 TaxID=2735676 RepID=UPI00345D2003
MTETDRQAVVAEGPVLLDLVGAVAHIRLNRPEASNGISIAFLKQFHDVIMRCHGDARIRAVLLSGEGANFCAGGDVREFASKGEELPDFLRQATAYLQICASGLIHLDAPVVAAVQGYAAGGGGLGLVCAADIVIAAENSKYLAGATRVGMAPDAGSSVVLPRLIGFRRAMDLLLTNRIMDANEAFESGLVSRVVPDDRLQEEASAIAQSLAAGAPKALSATKRLLWSGLGLSVDSCFPEEARTVSELSGTHDAREGLAAVIERRAANFTGR